MKKKIVRVFQSTAISVIILHELIFVQQADMFAYRSTKDQMFDGMTNFLTTIIFLYLSKSGFFIHIKTELVKNN